MQTAPLPIVFAPGLACTSRLFLHQATELQKTNSISFANTTTHDSIAELAAASLRQAPGQFILVGLSMGGYIAFEMVRQAPERIAALAILNSSARADTPEATQQRLRLIKLAQHHRLEIATKINFPRSVHPTRRTDATLLQTVLEMTREVGSQAYIRQQRAIMERQDSMPKLSQIHCPTLVIVGDHDLLTPPERSEEIANTINKAELSIIPDCGHLSTLEQPEIVTQLMRRWIDKLN